MNNTIGFPPADALLEMISSVDYKKHLQQFVMLSATLLGITVGVLQFLYNKTAQWYFIVTLLHLSHILYNNSQHVRYT